MGPTGEQQALLTTTPSINNRCTTVAIINHVVAKPALPRERSYDEMEDHRLLIDIIV